MHVPNELVEYIFEYVYSSLCIHLGQSEPDFPIGAKFVFSNFSLVSRTWHSLALPFLVRHTDGENVEAFTEFVGSKQLSRSVKSLYLNPNFEGWPQPRDYESDSDCSGWNDDRIGCGWAAKEDWENEIQNEFERWKKLLLQPLPSLTALEIGSRRRNKLERGPWYGEWHHRSDDDDQGYPYGAQDTAPALDLVPFLKALPSNRQLRTLRLNLPDEASILNCHGEPAQLWVDEQFADTISSRFPNLEHYTLHSHSELSWDQRLEATSMLSLRSLEVYNVVSTPSGLSENLRPTYLLPSATTLRILKLHIYGLPRQDYLGIDDLFGSLQFPSLEELDIDSNELSCGESDFFDRFPRIRIASIPLGFELPDDDILPDLPSSLSYLKLSRLTDASITHLAVDLLGENLSHLTHLVLQSKADSPNYSGGLSLPLFETSETPTDDLATIIEICQRNLVEVCYATNMTDEFDHSEEEEDDSDDEEEEASEDENWDWDAEEGENFRSFWSEEKQRSRDIGESTITLASF
jgi:hypothetical protein